MTGSPGPRALKDTEGWHVCWENTTGHLCIVPRLSSDMLSVDNAGVKHKIRDQSLAKYLFIANLHS